MSGLRVNHKPGERIHHEVHEEHEGVFHGGWFTYSLCASCSLWWISNTGKWTTCLV
jgi:molybdenum cofactor biosynthesis enzyme MoaA